MEIDVCVMKDFTRSSESAEHVMFTPVTTDQIVCVTMGIMETEISVNPVIHPVEPALVLKPMNAKHALTSATL